MAHSVLRIGVMELRRRPGTQRDVHIATSLPGLTVTASRVPDDAELVLDATLESLDGGITVTGTAEVPWTAECRRCLDEVRGVLTVELKEVFEVRPTDGETYPIDGDEVDLEPVLRDAALLNLPLAPLCRTDCAGPAPDAFPAIVPGDEPAEDRRDPRWAALDELRLDPD